MTRILEIPSRAAARAAASPAGPAPTMTSWGSLSMGRRIEQLLHPGAAIEALAAAEHGARPPLETFERTRRHRRSKRRLDLAPADPLAMADDLTKGRRSRDEVLVLPRPLRCLGKIGNGDRVQRRL